MTNYNITIDNSIYSNGYTVDMVEGDSLKFSSSSGNVVIGGRVFQADFGIYGDGSSYDYPTGDTYCSYPAAFKSSTYWGGSVFDWENGCLFFNRTSMSLPAGNYFFTAMRYLLSTEAITRGKKITVNVASSSNIHAKVNGTWKDGKVYVNVNGTWKEGTPYVNVNGTWKEGK